MGIKSFQMDHQNGEKNGAEKETKKKQAKRARVTPAAAPS